MNRKSRGEINSLILIPILLIIVPSVAFLVGHQKEKKTQTTVAPTNSSSNLYLVPDKINKTQKEIFPVKITLDTNSRKIVYAKVKLLFDKNILRISKDTQTREGMTVEKKTSLASANSSGTFNLILTVPGSAIEPSGTVDLATIFFEGIAQGSAKVNFDIKESQVVTKDEKLIDLKVSESTFNIR